MIATLNIQNIWNNLVGVIDNCLDVNIDIIFLCETYFKRGHLHCKWKQFHNYAIMRDDSPGFKHFGLSFLICPDLPYKVHSLSIQNGEVLSLKVGLYTLHGFYLPPSMDDVEAAERYNSLSVDLYTIFLRDMNSWLGSLTGDTRTNNHNHALST